MVDIEVMRIIVERYLPNALHLYKVANTVILNIFDCHNNFSLSFIFSPPRERVVCSPHSLSGEFIIATLLSFKGRT